MKIIPGKEQDFAALVDSSRSDFYSREIVEYAQRWADLMEKEIASGIGVREIMLSTSYAADIHDITGAMHRLAKGVLRQFWFYGSAI